MIISAKAKQNGPEAARETGLVPLPEEVFLTIMVDGRRLGRLSCSPFGHRELVLGWLFGQDLISGPADAEAIELDGEHALVRLRAGSGGQARRHDPDQVTACSGGDVHLKLFSNLPSIARTYDFELAQAIHLMEQLPAWADMFRKHGGIHCSMLADMKEQRLLVSREDIGRSNSVDKVVGWGLDKGLDFGRTALLTTGRISAEMAIKTLHAGIPTLISQTTLTSKALEIVRRTGLTLIGHVLKPRPILLNL
jgi:FdhD protein